MERGNFGLNEGIISVKYLISRCVDADVVVWNGRFAQIPLIAWRQALDVSSDKITTTMCAFEYMVGKSGVFVLCLDYVMRRL